MEGVRKGIADLNERAKVSQRVNERMVNALASIDSSLRLEELIAPLQKAVNWKRRRVRGLRPFGEDYRLLEAINVETFSPAACATRICRVCSMTVSHRPETRMLRAHKLIQKVPHRHQYQVRPEARTLLVAIVTAARTSLNQINSLQQAA